MIRAFRIALALLLAGLVVIQFFPTEKNVAPGLPATDFLRVNEVPENVAMKLRLSCYDCHSNNTNYPWYSRIQPAAWYLEHHIKDGKEELNFSEWNSLSDRRKRSKLSAVISQIEDGDMPLTSYTLVHWDAHLDTIEKSEIIDYMTQLKDKQNWGLNGKHEFKSIAFHLNLYSL